MAGFSATFHKNSVNWPKMQIVAEKSPESSATMPDRQFIENLKTEGNAERPVAAGRS